MLPNDRLGKNRLPVCPRAQIADVLEPLVAPMQRRASAESVNASIRSIAAASGSHHALRLRLGGSRARCKRALDARGGGCGGGGPPAGQRGRRENWPWLRRASAHGRESSRRGYSHEENPAIGASVISLPPVNRFNESSDLISRHKAARCKTHRCRNPLVCCNRLCAYHFAEIATK